MLLPDEINFLYRTHLPSAEKQGWSSKSPLVICTGLPPSELTRQRCRTSCARRNKNDITVSRRHRWIAVTIIFKRQLFLVLTVCVHYPKGRVIAHVRRINQFAVRSPRYENNLGRVGCRARHCLACPAIGSKPQIGCLIRVNRDQCLRITRHTDGRIGILIVCNSFRDSIWRMSSARFATAQSVRHMH